MNRLIGMVFLFVFCAGSAVADDVAIEMVELNKQGDSWNARVTLRHADTGWDHYADGWRVVDGSGKELGYRKLWHPHVKEQPFTRGLEGIVIPSVLETVYVEAHDKVHGWAKQRVTVNLKQSEGDRYRVNR